MSHRWVVTSTISDNFPCRSAIHGSLIDTLSTTDLSFENLRHEKTIVSSFLPLFFRIWKRSFLRRCRSTKNIFSVAVRSKHTPAYAFYNSFNFQPLSSLDRWLLLTHIKFRRCKIAQNTRDEISKVEENTLESLTGETDFYIASFSLSCS